MKLTFLPLLIIASTITASGQWTESFDYAKQRAASQDKIIFALFTGSDWCPPCINLEATVLSNPAFQRAAQEKAILFKADYPRRKAQKPAIASQNQRLAQTYGIRNYPTMLLIDASGSKIQVVKGQRTAANIVEQIHGGKAKKRSARIRTFSLVGILVVGLAILRFSLRRSAG